MKRGSIAWLRATEVVRGILDGMATRPGRSVLTGLSVAMVTAATVAGVTIGRTSQGAIAGAFASTASGYVTIRVPEGRDLALNLGDVTRGATTAGMIATAATVRGSGFATSAHFTEEPTQAVDVLGVEGDIASSVGMDITWGRTFDPGHLERGDRVALVGSSAAAQLEMAKPDGRTALLIDGRPFLVLGVFGTSTGDPALVSSVLIPRESFDVETNRIDAVYALTQPLEVANGAARLAARLAPNDYQLLNIRYDAGELGLNATVVGEVRALTAGLLVVGSLVAIIVVGSLATASISERRREIAVRKALGATSAGIGVRFVGESVLVGLGGACAGVLVGLGLSVAVAELRAWQLITEPGIVWLAIAQGLIASTIGASLPAIRAARLDPAEALSRL